MIIVIFFFFFLLCYLGTTTVYLTHTVYRPWDKRRNRQMIF